MTATATRMVKAIWHAYFVRTGIQLPGGISVRLHLVNITLENPWAGMPASRSCLSI